MDRKKEEYQGVDWVQLAQDRVQRLAVVNMVVDLWASQDESDFLIN
jgi:hypothetical protein